MSVWVSGSHVGGKGKRRRQFSLRASTSLLLLITVGVATILGAAAAPAGATEAAGVQRDGRDVELKVEAGLAGVVGVGVPVPLRLTISSKRAQVVSLEIGSQFGMQSAKVELAADAPTVVDTAVTATPFLDITVRNLAGRNLANRSMQVAPDQGLTVVGVGTSLFSKGTPKKSATVGGIQEAVLVPLDDELLARPGALDSLSGIVVDSGDLDSMSQATRNAIREWVWTGGDLVVDVEQRSELPVVGEPSTGAATPIGSGWVRFSSGAAGRGLWSTFLEPAPVRAAAIGTADSEFAGLSVVESGMLVSVGFIPTWVVALAVFGSALLGGPIAWFLLRTRSRRMLIWGLAPGLSLLVAGALVVAGNGVFTGATTRVFADVIASPWSERGSVFSGLKASSTIELTGGAQLIAAHPDPSVTTSGAGSAVRVNLRRNSFGAVGVAGLQLSDSPRVEVEAVAQSDGTAKVTVTNRSKAEFRNVSISGNGRVRDFKSVKPGTSESLPFQMSSDLNVFNQTFVVPARPDGGSDFRDPLHGLRPTQSRGLVLVRGLMQSSVSTAGLSGDGLVAIQVLVPVQPKESEDGTAALRLDEIGGVATWQRQQFVERGFEQDADGLSNPQVTVENAPPQEQPPGYLRLSSQRGRQSATCGVATNVSQVDAWDGKSWAPLQKVGAPYIDDREVGFQGNGHEMQDWMIPAVAAGGRLHLRVSGWVVSSPATMLFQCGGRP